MPTRKPKKGTARKTLATFTITKRDYVRALCFHALPRGFRMFFILLLFGVILGIGYMSESILLKILAYFGALFATLFWMVFQFLILPLIAKRDYRKYKLAQEPYTLSFTTEALKIKTPNAQGKVTWDKFYIWRESQHYLMLYLNPRLYYIVPKYLEKDADFDLSGLRILLEKHVKKG